MEKSVRKSEHPNGQILPRFEQMQYRTGKEQQFSSRLQAVMFDTRRDIGTAVHTEHVHPASYPHRPMPEHLHSTFCISHLPVAPLHNRHPSLCRRTPP